MRFSPRVANEIARLMRDPDSMRDEWERMKRSGRRGHYDPNQPRVAAGNPGGGQWTDIDGEATASGPNDSEQPQLAQFSLDRAPIPTPVRPPVEKPLRPPALPPARHPGGPGWIGALLSLYAIWSARNTPERRAVLEFNAREYLIDRNGDLVEADVKRLNREQVRNACPSLPEVQNRTNEAVNDVMQNGGRFMSRQQFGTAVHKRLEDLVNGDANSNLRAEVSRVKSKDADAEYGTKGSVRIDLLECAPAKTTCVYDIKTGDSRNSGLSSRRMLELALHAFKVCKETESVIVTEVRPSQ